MPVKSDAFNPILSDFRVHALQKNMNLEQ